MELATAIQHEEIELHAIWEARRTLFPNGFADAQGLSQPGIMNIFALAAAQALYREEIPTEFIQLTVDELEMGLQLLEENGQHTEDALDEAKQQLAMRFASDSDEQEIIFMSSFMQDMCAAARSLKDLYLLPRLLEAISSKMELNEILYDARFGVSVEEEEPIDAAASSSELAVNDLGYFDE